MTQVLYNPFADNGMGEKKAFALGCVFPEKELSFSDITKIENLEAYLENISDGTDIILAGGDGTINRFINNLNGKIPDVDVYYYPLGSGNDFFNDVENDAENGLVYLNKYIENLPMVTVNGKTSFFINGIGYGIDGYCCEEGDRQRKKSYENKCDKRINYTAIAIKGLFFFYHSVNAFITVDGSEHEYSRVYLAPSMKGRFYGGGMMITPGQERLSENGELTVAVAHDTNRFNILRVFPSIFKGKHIKYKRLFSTFKGHNITVRFDRPTALQIDGETVSNVLEYSVKSKNPVSANKKFERLSV